MVSMMALLAVDILGLTLGEVQDSKICDTRGCQGVTDFTILHLLRCLTLYSHPFLPCQCLFTFCVVWRINLRMTGPKCHVICERERALYGIKCVLRIF